MFHVNKLNCIIVLYYCILTPAIRTTVAKISGVICMTESQRNRYLMVNCLENVYIIKLINYALVLKLKPLSRVGKW